MVSHDPACEDLVAGLREFPARGEHGAVVVREVNEPCESGHPHLIGDAPERAIPLRGALRTTCSSTREGAEAQRAGLMGEWNDAVGRDALRRARQGIRQ